MKILAVVYTFLFLCSINAQIVDSTLNVPAIRDSLVDNLNNVINDTLSATETDIDTVIYASASDSIFFFVKEKKMNIYGKGKLNYRTTEITSANIFLDFRSNLIDAQGIKSDSSEEYIGTPVLKEGAEVYDGFRMKYNFKTQQGFISAAETEQEGAFYDGEKIKKVDKETYFVEDGTYTTCDASCPHYYFSANKMKVIHKEQIVAEWIWLYFGGVPFPVPLPFGVFPIESGRRSGLIPPAFGDDATYGKYFSRFGYFWAISDYMDWNLTGDYYTRGSYRLNSRFRYALRYNFSGNIEGNYERLISGLPTDNDRTEQTNWRLRINHNQSLTPTMRLDARLEFLSGNVLQRNITDLNEILRNDIVSNATLNKTWEESGTSLSLSYSRTQNLESGNISEVLPSLSFSKTQTYPFRREGSATNLQWYELFGFSYNGKFQNNRNKTAGDLKIRGGIQHNFSFGMSPKVGYFSVTPNISYTERWYNKRIERFAVYSEYSQTDSIITNDVKEINLVRSFNAGISASTKFYGFFSPGFFGIETIRHTVNPSISYNYTPDFSEPFWGYYDSYTKSDGSVVKYNKFEREVFGGPGAGESQSLSFRVSNIFEMKTIADPTDTTDKQEKIQLLNLDANFNYNFAADSLKFSNLNISYRTQIGDILNLQGSSSFTPYDYSNISDKINKFLIESGRGILRMTNFNFSVSTSLSGEKLKSFSEPELPPEIEPESYEPVQSDQSIYKGIYTDEDPDFTIPWNLSMSYNFSQSSPTPGNKFRSSNLSGSLNFNLTPNWKLSFTGSYDLVNKEFAAPQIRISRDLHCWIMNFTWNPIGTYRGYFLEIRVKAPQLQDLKITKRDQFYSGR